jgi:L-serine dehydratase
LLHIWSVMRECVATGLRSGGVLPGGLGVRRQASLLAAELDATPTDPLYALDWVTVYALAVNEENAAGGRVVTTPTNGAAGVIPAVLHYYTRFVPGADDDGVVEFLLTAGAIGVLFKANASISGAEVGCQGEVGSACSMAAAGLTAVMGGSPGQVENAAEIGIEHNLGLTCVPVGGLVQIPCIERNAVAAVKAITAARMALHGDGTHMSAWTRPSRRCAIPAQTCRTSTRRLRAAALPSMSWSADAVPHGGGGVLVEPGRFELLTSALHRRIMALVYALRAVWPAELHHSS